MDLDFSLKTNNLKGKTMENKEKFAMCGICKEREAMGECKICGVLLCTMCIEDYHTNHKCKPCAKQIDNYQDTLTENKGCAGINWQPKDSEPPKDGTAILVFCKDNETVCIARWRLLSGYNDSQEWVDVDTMKTLPAYSISRWTYVNNPKDK